MDKLLKQFTEQQKDIYEKIFGTKKFYKYPNDNLIKLEHNDKTKYNLNLIQDLEFFEPIQKESKNENTLFKILNKTHSKLGGEYLRQILLNPTFSKTQLKKRQKNIKAINKLLKKTNLEQKIKNILKNEDEYTWLSKPNDFWTHIHENLFFQYNLLDLLNKNEWFMMIYNFYQIVISPISTVITPFYTILIPIIYLKMSGINIPFIQLAKFAYKLVIQNLGFSFLKSKSAWGMIISTLIWLGLYILNVYTSITGAQEKYKNLKLIYNKVNLINNLSKETTEIIKVISTNKTLTNNFITKELLESIKKIQLTNSLGNYSYLSNKGKICKLYNKLIDTQEPIYICLNFLARIDYYIGLTKLLNNNYSYAKYSTKQTNPHIKIKNCWHPCLTNPTKNSINTKKNVLITGPNAAGKSTFIKTLMLNVYLAQTLGIAPAEKIKTTLFENYYCHLFLMDDKGEKSLFQTEVSRCQNYLSYLEQHNDKPTLLIMDEIFSSTNYIEGMAAAHAFCDTIYKYENNISFITTHHTLLNKLENNVINKKFEAIVNENKIEFPYTITNGYSQQHLALQLLKQSNLNPEFLQRALQKAEEIEETFN
jgi:DNA mismatch repair ATPase MutS